MFVLRGAEDTYHLTAQTLVGRHLGDIVLPNDTQVSKRHCLFEVMEDVVRLTDLGSTNGTFVEGERLVADEPQLLRAGQSIVIGRTQFVLDMDHRSHIKVEIPEVESETTEPEITESPPEVKPEKTKPSRKVDLKEPYARVCLFVFVIVLVSLLLDSSLQFGYKYSPLPFWLVRFASLFIAAAFIAPPARMWFGGQDKSLKSMIVALVVLFAMQNQLSSLLEKGLELEVQRKTNQIFGSCIVKSHRARCFKATSDCPQCLEKMSNGEMSQIQDLLTRVSESQ